MTMQWTQVEGREQYTAEASDCRWYAVLTRVPGPAWELEFTGPDGKVLRYFETGASATADAQYRAEQLGLAS